MQGRNRAISSYAKSAAFSVAGLALHEAITSFYSHVPGFFENISLFALQILLQLGCLYCSFAKVQPKASRNIPVKGVSNSWQMYFRPSLASESTRKIAVFIADNLSTITKAVAAVALAFFVLQGNYWYVAGFLLFIGLHKLTQQRYLPLPLLIFTEKTLPKILLFLSLFCNIGILQKLAAFLQLSSSLFYLKFLDDALDLVIRTCIVRTFGRYPHSKARRIITSAVNTTFQISNVFTFSACKGGGDPRLVLGPSAIAMQKPWKGRCTSFTPRDMRLLFSGKGDGWTLDPAYCSGPFGLSANLPQEENLSEYQTMIQRHFPFPEEENLSDFARKFCEHSINSEDLYKSFKSHLMLDPGFLNDINLDQCRDIDQGIEAKAKAEGTSKEAWLCFCMCKRFRHFQDNLSLKNSSNTSAGTAKSYIKFRTYAKQILAHIRQGSEEL